MPTYHIMFKYELNKSKNLGLLSGLKLRLVAGPVLADVAAPQPQLHQGPGLDQAVAQQHQGGGGQLVNIPVSEWSVTTHSINR